MVLCSCTGYLGYDKYYYECNASVTANHCKAWGSRSPALGKSSCFLCRSQAWFAFVSTLNYWWHVLSHACLHVENDVRALDQMCTFDIGCGCSFTTKVEISFNYCAYQYVSFLKRLWATNERRWSKTVWFASELPISALEARRSSKTYPECIHRFVIKSLSIIDLDASKSNTFL